MVIVSAAIPEQAEKAAAAAAPGKIFRPDGAPQVSVNHWQPRVALTVPCSGAEGRKRPRGCFAFRLVDRVRI
jgi:hypothetical protein